MYYDSFYSVNNFKTLYNLYKANYNDLTAVEVTHHEANFITTDITTTFISDIGEALSSFR